VCLVTKVDTSFEKLAHAEFRQCHFNFPFPV
jgi:hypothetical protein